MYLPTNKGTFCSYVLCQLFYTIHGTYISFSVGISYLLLSECYLGQSNFTTTQLLKYSMQNNTKYQPPIPISGYQYPYTVLSPAHTQSSSHSATVHLPYSWLT